MAVRPYGNKIQTPYINRRKQTTADDWNDVSSDVSNILDRLYNVETKTNEINVALQGGELVNAIDVLNVEIGSYKSGDTILAKTKIETILKNLLQKIKHPEYIEPSDLTLKLYDENNNEITDFIFEIGTTLHNVKIVSEWNQNDAGPTTLYNVNINGNWIYDSTDVTKPDISENIIETIIPEITIESTNPLSIYSVINYSETPETNYKINNFNEIDSTNKINAGIKQSQIISLSGKKQCYWNFNNIVPNDANTILIMNKKQLIDINDSININTDDLILNGNTYLTIATPIRIKSVLIPELYTSLTTEFNTNLITTVSGIPNSLNDMNYTFTYYVYSVNINTINFLNNNFKIQINF